MLFGYPGCLEGEVSRITQFQIFDASVAATRPTDTHQAVRQIEPVKKRHEAPSLARNVRQTCVHIDLLNRRRGRNAHISFFDADAVDCLELSFSSV